jgi:sulfotransferase
MKKIHFCTGLPRAGSTVLMNILQQNPELYTTATDPLPFILHKKILVRSRYNEQTQAMDQYQANAAYRGLIRGAAEGWYQGLTDKPNVISKCRGWANLHHLFPESKALVLVRDLRDVAESFDKVNRKLDTLCSLSESDVPYNSMPTEQKFSFYFHEQSSVKEAMIGEVKKFMLLFQDNRSKIKFIRYEDLLKDPIQMLHNIYDFLGMEYYKHDLNNIQQSEMIEHDNAYFAEKTDHKTHPKMLPWNEPIRTLGDEFHDNVIKEHLWFYKSFYPEVLA